MLELTNNSRSFIGRVVDNETFQVVRGEFPELSTGIRAYGLAGPLAVRKRWTREHVIADLSINHARTPSVACLNKDSQ